MWAVLLRHEHGSMNCFSFASLCNAQKRECNIATKRIIWSVTVHFCMQACIWTGDTARDGGASGPCNSCLNKCVVYANTSDILTGAMFKVHQDSSCLMLGPVVVQMATGDENGHNMEDMKDLVRSGRFGKIRSLGLTGCTYHNILPHVHYC